MFSVNRIKPFNPNTDVLITGDLVLTRNNGWRKISYLFIGGELFRTGNTILPITDIQYTVNRPKPLCYL